ncbi:MAG: hypothetical protein SNJ57_15725 [Cyanobacteriota bacterium]
MCRACAEHVQINVLLMDAFHLASACLSRRERGWVTATAIAKQQAQLQA